MHRIDNPTAITALPPPEPVGTPGFFTNGNRPTGLVPTRVDDGWLNTVQEEIVTVVLGAGLQLSKTSNTQLYEAIQAIAYGANPDLSAYLPLAGGLMNLQVPFSINTNQFGLLINVTGAGGGGFAIEAGAGFNAGIALRAQGGGTSCALSFTVGSQIYSMVAAGQQLMISDDTTGTAQPRLQIQSNGNVTIPGGLNVAGNQAEATYQLLCYGPALKTAPYEWQMLSFGDEVDQGPFELGLETLRQLTPVTLQTPGGLAYQSLDPAEVRRVLPELLGQTTAQRSGEEIEAQTLDLSPLRYMLINAVKELADRVEALERRRAS